MREPLDVEKARYNMIEQQVRTWDVLDPRVLDLLAVMPREAFVPPRYRGLAFADMQIPLGHGEVMMEPKVEGRTLQALDPQPQDTALEIGTGSGYITACLGRLAGHVVSVDIFPDFQAEARAKLEAQGVRNVSLVEGDAAAGWDDGRRYECIAVTGSLPELHQGFHRSLAVGGRLLVIVGEPPMMEGLLITRVGEDQWSTESLFDTVLPPLVNARKTRAFAL